MFTIIIIFLDKYIRGIHLTQKQPKGQGNKMSHPKTTNYRMTVHASVVTKEIVKKLIR